MTAGPLAPDTSTGRPAARRLADFPARRNSLNALRLALAVLVIVSHAWPLGRFGNDPRLGALTLGEVAVAGFFAISGWLITQSRLSGGLAGYAWRRSSASTRAMSGGLRAYRVGAAAGSADELQRLALRLRPSRRVGRDDRGLGQLQRA